MTTKLIASAGRGEAASGSVEIGRRHGSPTDQIDVEVVAELDTFPDRGMGFSCATTRTDRCARQCLIYSDWRSRAESNAN